MIVMMIFGQQKHHATTDTATHSQHIAMRVITIITGITLRDRYTKTGNGIQTNLHGVTNVRLLVMLRMHQANHCIHNHINLKGRTDNGERNALHGSHIRIPRSSRSNANHNVSTYTTIRDRNRSRNYGRTRNRDLNRVY